MDTIQYLLSIIKTLYQQNCWLLAFICRYIPLKQWAFDDSHSPKYEKFRTDPLPMIIPTRHEDWKLLTGQRTASTALPAPTMTLLFGLLTTTFFVRILTHTTMC